MTLSPAVRPLLTPVILVGAYVILVTFTRDLQSLWPLQVGNANWRFGAAGFFLTTGAVPALGLALMVVGATLGDHRGLAKAVGAFGVGLGLFVAAVLVLFFVDSRSVLASAQGASSEDLVAGAIRRSLVLGISASPAYLVLGWAALRAAGRMEGPVARTDTGIVVGNQSR